MEGKDAPPHHFLQRGSGTSAIAKDGLGALEDSGSSAMYPPLTHESAMSQTQVSQAARKRPRFVTAQDLDEALLQAIEGKITRKNAWVSKDASNLLGGITQTIEDTLDPNSSTDEYTSFAKVATVVEGCSKVWTSRVDSTYQRSNQMVRRLLRNEEGECGSDGEGKEGADGDPSDPAFSSAAAAAERRKRAAQRRGQDVRTVALDLSEINLDRKARVALERAGVSAQFRAITEKFDQGNSQGLLVNNTPIGGSGNFILDTDYARGPEESYVAQADNNRIGSSGVNSVAEDHGHVQGRHANHSNLNDQDDGLNIAIDLPPVSPSLIRLFTDGGTLSMESISQTDMAVAGTEGVRESVGSKRSSKQGRASTQSAVLQSLLAVRNSAGSIAEELSDNASPDLGGSEEGPRLHSGEERWSNGMDAGGNDYGAYGFDADGDDEIGVGGEVNGYAEVPPGRIGLEAHHLVSADPEFNAVEGQFFGKDGHKLELENHAEWYPMAEPEGNPLFGAKARKNPEIARIRKEHRFLGPSMAQSQSINTQTDKRAKREAIEFNISAELAAISATVRVMKGKNTTVEKDSTECNPLFLRCGVDILEKSHLDSSALKQSTTGKNVTTLGKDFVIKRDVETIRSLMSTSAQQIKAKMFGLLRCEDPQPGKTIPDFLPHPITMPVFFQPFSTSHTRWNLLRKSAAGSTADHYVRPTEYSFKDKKQENSEAGDMPAEFFHGDGDDGDDFGDVFGYDDFNRSGMDSDIDNPLKLAQAQLFASLEQAELMRASGQLASGVNANVDDIDMAHGGFADVDSDFILKVLHAPGAMLSTQVNVVLLRKIMWNALCKAASRDVGLKEEVPRSSGRKAARGKRASGNNNGDDERDQGTGRRKVLFSEVVLQLLPQVATFSATGTLSPAFFFFCLLFLSNEHGLMIESVPALDDLVVYIPEDKIDFGRAVAEGS